MKIHLNRALLCNFFVSCSHILEADGEVLVTLCAGQGGTKFEGTNRRWDDTWQIVEQAAHGGFVLSHVDYFPHMLFKEYHPVGYRGREQRFSVTSSVLHVFKIVTFPIASINSDYINQISDYHVLERDGNLAVSYAHKLAIIKNPLQNCQSAQYFLTKKLHEFVSKHLMNISIVSNLPYHTVYNSMKAPCFFNGSLHSLRSTLLDVVPSFKGCYSISEGLVFQKFGPNFSDLSFHCQVIIGGSNSFLVIKDFVEFIERIFNFDGSLSFKQCNDEWFILMQSDTMSSRKVIYSDVSYNSIIIDVDLLCSFVMKVSIKEIWAEKTIFDETSFRLSLPSLYPLEFSFDISFASKNDLDELEFFNVLHNAPDNLIDSVELLSVYQHPNIPDKSYCYRLKYKSYERPLYRKLAIDIHRYVVSKLLESVLDVKVH
nr:uncharacterized protein LOC106680244 isoform X1 [Halyomorpha halys]